jgi:TonB family protein
MTAIRRALQDTLIGARAERMSTLSRSFNISLAANRLLQPPDDSAKAHFLAMINIDASAAPVISARQSLAAAYLAKARNALTINDLPSADGWLAETHTIGYNGDDLATLEKQLGDARTVLPQRTPVVGANSLQRLYYVPPKFPASAQNRGITGWVETEFTVRADGSTGDIVVTNSSPRRTFDNAAMLAVAQWRYQPVIRDGKPVEQRAAVRIRFSDE